MASTVAAIEGANKFDVEATTRRRGGLLAIHGIQSRTIGGELAWGRTPVEVSSIFYFTYFFIFALFISCIYTIISIQKNQKYKTQRN